MCVFWSRLLGVMVWRSGIFSWKWNMRISSYGKRTIFFENGSNWDYLIYKEKGESWLEGEINDVYSKQNDVYSFVYPHQWNTTKSKISKIFSYICSEEYKHNRLVQQRFNSHFATIKLYRVSKGQLLSSLIKCLTREN